MKEIGLILRKRREEKKLSLETVNRKTHIPLKFLIALEEGDLATFPAEVYFTGSLRKYAAFLGLDPDQLVAQYRLTAKGPEKEAAPATKEERRPVSGNRATLAAAAGAVVIILIVLGAVLAFIISRSRQNVAPETPQELTPPSVSTATVPAIPKQSTATVAVPKQSTTTVTVPKRVAPKAVTPPKVSTTTAAAVPAPAAAPANTGVLSLHIRTTQPSWTKITADGAVVFQGTMGPGESRTWTASDRFSVVVGYAPAVSLTLNGKPIDVRSPAVQDVSEMELGWKDVTGGARQ